MLDFLLLTTITIVAWQLRSREPRKLATSAAGG